MEVISFFVFLKVFCWFLFYDNLCFFFNSLCIGFSLFVRFDFISLRNDFSCVRCLGVGVFNIVLILFFVF